MKHGSLFSGIGGFDLAAEWMGWDNVFHCEWNEFGQRVLKYYWPNAISYGDITKTDFTIHRGNIDILTGGFPCQPYSLAGKRKGKEDERHLWPEMLRAIREIQPTWIVGENVFGLINWNGGMVFNEVQTDLEAEGYEVQPYVLPACAVNAPHRRDRVWFVAYSNSGRNTQSELQYTDIPTGSIRDNKQITPYANSNGYEPGGFGENRPTQGTGESEQKKRERVRANDRGIGESGIATDTSRQGLPFGIRTRFRSVSGTTESFQRREFTRNNTKRSWSEFPTQSPLCDRNDGLSDRLAFNPVWRGVKPRNPKGYPTEYITFAKWRKESIKAMGNAIVPQIALQLFKAIAEYKNI